MREFYSPGIILNTRPIFDFTSERISSREMLIDSSVTLDNLIPKRKSEKVVFQNENEIILKDDNGVYIYFIKPISEMETANGFYDYKDKDKKLVSNKNWYASMIIRY